MKKVLLYLILIMAVAMAGIVAYVSVGGLMKVFSGAGTLGLLFFSAIEIAKVVATSAIHTYGKKIGWIYKGLLSLGIGIAMLITSIGIYGFLSSTYKETFMKLESVEAQVSLLVKQRDGYQGQLDNVNKEKESINVRISELSSGLSNNVIQYKDPETGQIITTTSSSTRRALEKQLNSSIERLDKVSLKSDELNGKVFDLDNQITEVKLGNDSAAELGPLKYLAEVTGKSMDEVMKYFIFLLIVIGDPMAVLMVIVFNKVVNKEEKEGKEEPVKPKKSSWLDKVKNPFIKKEKVEPMVVTDGTLKPSIYNTDGILEVESVTDKTKEEVVVDPETGNINVKYNQLSIPEDVWIGTKDDAPVVSEDETKEVVSDETEKDIIEDTHIDTEVNEIIEEEESPVVEEVKEEPKVDEGKVTIDDIKEKKEERDRGFSVRVPDRKKSNTVDRIGSNKEIRNGDSGTVYFKRR